MERVPGEAPAESSSRPSVRKISLDDESTRAFFDGADDHVQRLHREALAVVEAEHAEARHPVMARATEQDLRRRDRLRKLVLSIVAVAAAASLIVALKSRSPSVASPPPAVVAARPLPHPAPVAPASTPARAEPAVAPSPDAAPTPSSEVAAAPTTSAAPSAAPATSEAPSAASSAQTSSGLVDAEAARELRKEANKLLNLGKYKAAVEKAEAAIQGDPEDANAYLYLGTALMELGKMADAKRAFRTCVERAKRGPKHECAQFR